MATLTEALDDRHAGRMRNLVRANEVRMARARLKRRIASGEVPIADVLLSVPAEAASCEISELLLAQRQWGVRRLRKFLARLQISETTSLRALTERQRRMIAEAPGRPTPRRNRPKGLSAIDRAVLGSLALYDGEGAMLAVDVASEVGMQSAISTLCSLRQRGFVLSEAIAARGANGWILTNAGRDALAPALSEAN